MRYKFARATALLLMAIAPFIIAWSLVLLTAGHIKHTAVFDSHLFWVPSMFYWSFYCVWLIISAGERQRERDRIRAHAKKKADEFVEKLMQSSIAHQRKTRPTIERENPRYRAPYHDDTFGGKN
jgi:hypothetical protein